MIVRRMIRAARLDVSLYEQVKNDVSLTTEAALVALLAVLLWDMGLAMPPFGFAALALTRVLIGGLLGGYAPPAIP